MLFSGSLWSRMQGLSTAQRVAVISFFGQLYFFVPVMTPYLRGEGLSMAQIAGLQTVLLWAQLLMEVPTGVLADRLGHRHSYQIALVLSIAGEFIVLIAHNYTTFLLAQIVSGTGFAFASGSVDAYVYESLPAGNRTQGMQRARGGIGAAIHLASVIAYGTTALVAADLTRPRMVLTLVMGIAGLSVAVLISLTLRDRPGVVVDNRPTSTSLLRTSWNVIRGNRQLQRVMLLSLAANAFGAHLLVFYQEYFLQSGVSGRWFGLALSLGSVVAIGTQMVAWRMVPLLGIRWAMIVATGIPGVLYVAMALNHDPVLAVVLFIIQWGAVQLSAPLFAGLFNEHLPDHARATSLSLISGLVTIYVGVMGIFLGWLAGQSLAIMFGLMGVLVLLGATLVQIRPDADTDNDQVEKATAPVTDGGAGRNSGSSPSLP